MVDPTFPTPEHQQEMKQLSRYPAGQSRKHRLIPSHAERTLAEWDNYRATERMRLDAMGARDTTDVEITDEGGNKITVQMPTKVDYFKSCIQDFPTPERLAQLPDLNKQEQANYKAMAATLAEKKRLRNIPSFWQLRRKPFGFIINEGGRGVTLSVLPKRGLPFRLYVAGWVLMLQRGKWSFGKAGTQ
jgi:hypothetical protein